MFRSPASRLDYVPKVLETPYHHWRSIVSQLKKSDVQYRGNALCREQPTIKHSVPWTIAPMVFLVCFTLRSGIVLVGYILDTAWIHSSLVRLILGNEIYPPETRFMFEATAFVCSFYSLVSQAFVLTRKLHNYRFLAILAIDKTQTIKPSMLSLKPEDYHKLSVFIDSCINIVRWFSLSKILYSTIFYYTNWSNRLLCLPLLPLTLVHIFAFHYWVVNISLSLYYHPLFLSIVVYYHRHKAGSILSCLDRFDNYLRNRGQISKKNKKSRKLHMICKIFYLRRYNSLVKCYVRFMQEVKEYQQHYWSHYLGLLFAFGQVNITFLVWLVVVEKLPTVYRCGLMMITLAVIINLMLAVYCCRFIYTINRAMAKGLFSLNFWLQQLRVFRPRENFKLESNCINIRNKSDGFRLFNGQLISSKTFIKVIFNISTIFCLIFKIKFD